MFGEDKRKIENIVTANLPEFQTLYQPHLQNIVVQTSNGRMKKVNINQLLLI